MRTSSLKALKAVQNWVKGSYPVEGDTFKVKGFDRSNETVSLLAACKDRPEAPSIATWQSVRAGNPPGLR
jgi:hypothetical protein